MMKTVNVLRITKVSPADSLGERIFFVGYGHYMDVIVHQAIADDFKSVFFCLLFQQIKINAAIIIYKEYVLAIVTSLGDMMCETNGD